MVSSPRAQWRSFDVRQHHNASGVRKEWRFGGNCAESTAYTGVAVLGDEATSDTLLLVYDKTHIEVPKTKPKGDEVNYVFSTRVKFVSDP